MSRPPHVPGTGTIPDRAALAPVRDLCPARILESDAARIEPYLAGIDLFSAGYFWEAHEVWEPVWLACGPGSAERELLAGLIQLTNACLKLRMAMPKAAIRLLVTATEHLSEVTHRSGQHVMGLRPARLASEVTSFKRQLLAAANIDASHLDRRPFLDVDGLA